MLNLSLTNRMFSDNPAFYILIASIIIGSLFGHYLPLAGEGLSSLMDYTLLILVGLIFFSVRFAALIGVFKNIRFIFIALMANFVLVPLIGYCLASLFLSSNPLFMIGLVIYFMSPCTDWFLSFTKLSKGNVTLGTALIPINMALQLLLYPFYLQLFTRNSVDIDIHFIGNTLMQWFLLPLLFAIAAHYIFRQLLKTKQFEFLLDQTDHITLWLTALLVIQIFAGNISVTLEHFSVLAWVLLAVFSFFLSTFLLSKGLTYFFRLGYAEHALLTMTIASRNAPLMLAVTVVALPEQPLVYAAVVIGMLVELPHLTLLQNLLLSNRHRFVTEQ